MVIAVRQLSWLIRKTNPHCYFGIPTLIAILVDQPSWLFWKTNPHGHFVIPTLVASFGRSIMMAMLLGQSSWLLLVGQPPEPFWYDNNQVRFDMTAIKFSSVWQS